ncbi:hypothetical protein TanjilG_23345 [Lupinus angustifolius]|uniref:Uncharacterized protein n=1 Tax=Lupinus angustifolius TaxID=3871 RepID=A0A4P1R8Z2_LUPAN|nr:hypothetical protein TanjilG_23345 [Lupinus angustifolius]
MQLVRLLIEVKGIFVEKSEVLQKLELVDWIQKLGVANYFEKEVNEFLETTTFKNPSAQESLHVPALSFRLLRQHGYKVSPDVLLRKFFNENGTMLSKISCGDDVKDIMELFEASHLRFEEENILEEAKSVVINSLKDTFNVPSSININYEHSERVFHALELPSHWRVPWFDVKWHVKQYHKEKHMEHHLLQLAKLNFNLIQLQLRKEVKELSRWWENLGIEKELSFARNRLVESFMCSAGVAVQPKYKSLRKWLTKLITFILVIDDVYDIHASFEEVKLFTAAFERWDAKEIEELPECMRICFNSLKEVTDETAYEIAGEKNFNMVLSYIKKAWIEFCKALFEEAKWYSMEYIPSLKEYLSNAWISSSGSAERERGDAASSILCYMNEMEVSEDKARKHIEEMINNAWKKINWYGTNGVGSMEPFITQARNAARMAHTLYQNGDGFGIQDLDIKEHISSLLVEPL